MAVTQAGPSSTSTVKPRQVLYCEICSFPPEYCSYGSRISKCKKWLQDTHPDLFSKYYGESSGTTGDAVHKADAKENADPADKLEGLSLEEKDAAKKEAKAERKAAKEAERISNSKVLIKRQERTKRKMTTSIQGLEIFGIDLKKASKLFANKFATGASVSKNAAGEDEIVIQGDVAYDVEEMLLKKTGKEGDVFGGKVPEDNIDIIEVKKKKKAEEE